MADVSVRLARPGDVAEIARIQVETWRFGYREILPEPVLAALSTDTAAAAWQAALSAPPSPRNRVLVALEQQWVVGFAALAEPDDGGDDATLAVDPLLVEARWRRRGHGSRLIAAAVDHARQDGVTHLHSWIPEADTASREFLIGAGFAPDGLARALDTGSGELRQVRLHAAVPPS